MELNRSVRPSLRGAAFQLVTASFVVLALELALIRWVPAQVRVTAYFPNLILISAFLGLGIGCLLPRKPPIWTWTIGVAGSVALISAMARVAFTHEQVSEYLWLLYRDLPPGSPVIHGVRLPIVIVFVIGAMLFVPLGAFIAERLRLWREAGRPLIGYACDLGGSLLGVVAMAILFFGATRPVVWFGVVLAAAFLLTFGSRRAVIIHLAASAVALALVVQTDRADVYSPYYAIEAKTHPGSMEVLTNGSHHQIALPVRSGQPLPHAWMIRARDGYHLPYRLLGRPPRKVLVLGAGTGNDVSVALDEGAQSVYAVEIDPEILRLGRLHPDRPYADPRVRVFNTDARAFLNYNEETFDLIVFGTLDSMTRLSALSNVRLDNFVYTVECLERAGRHLTSDGGIVLYFSVGASYIHDHIAAMLVRAIDHQPGLIAGSFTMFNSIFLTGPAFDSAGGPSLQQLREAASLEDVPTDDWPFLYVRQRGISPFYLSVMGLLFAIAAVAVFAVSREMRASLISRTIDWEMFLFGLAFLLLETKLVTEMNLVWGATWVTSAVVFGSILLMILLGTLWMHVRPMKWIPAASGLIVALFLAWIIPVQWIVGRPFAARLTASVLFVGAPILFASLCFALVYRQRERPDVAFGWNMIGAVAGGLLEFLSMLVGMKALTLLAMTAYLIAFLIRTGRRTATEV